jgi:lipoteichoic acid synthase
MKPFLTGEILGRSRFAPTVERNSLIVQSTLALTLVILGIKVGKVLADFYSENPHAALGTVYSSWLVRLSVGICGVYLAGHVLWPRWKWKISVLPLILLVPAKLVLALVRGDPATAYVWLLEAGGQLWVAISIGLYVLRRDLIFLASFAVISYLAVTFLESYRLGRILLRTSVGLLLLVSGIELACYCKMGVTGTGHLLAYFLTNAASLWPMLRPELDIVSISALLAPVTAGFLTVWLISRSYARGSSSPARSLARAWPIVLSVFLAAEFVPVVPVDHRFDRFAGDTYLSLGDLLPWSGSTQLEAARQASRMPPLCDTTNAILRGRDSASASFRNVVIIMLESARASATSVGNPMLGNTPFLAEFAKRSAVVPEMYAVIPRTSAAWVAVLDGIWPSTDEEMAGWAQNGEPLKSLPVLLATRGYSSAYFTSAHLSFGYDAPLIKKEQFGEVLDGDGLPNQGFEQPTFWGFEDRIMLEPSLSWVEQQRDRKNPFLLVMMTTIGHYDYKYPVAWQTQSFSASDVSYNSYLNCLSYVDSMLKGLIEGLDKLGVLRSSIVIILGDHGESFGEHGPRIHSLGVYEETLRIPAIIYADGLIPPGTLIPGLRQEVDVLPTVLDALGLTPENTNFPGTSFFRPVPADRTLYFSSSIYSHSVGMRKGGLKYIYNFGRTPTEVYAIDHDPGERHDIAATLPRSAIDKAEIDMLVWRERVSRAFMVKCPPPPPPPSK